MGGLPEGTVTFLFTDVEGSTELLGRVGPDAYGLLLVDFRRLADRLTDETGGRIVDTQGDALFVAFTSASGAVDFAGRLQEGLAATELRVRIGVHTGQPTLTSTGYIGLDVQRYDDAGALLRASLESAHRTGWPRNPRSTSSARGWTNRRSRLRGPRAAR